MAVFVCGADESADQNPRKFFFYGGYAGPIDMWDGDFARAWNERVLNGPPQIPYFHMTSMLSPAWLKKYGLTEIDASRRIDEATRVIQSTGSLIPVNIFLNEEDYNSIVRRPYRRVGRFKPRSLEPDYLCFLFYALTQLDWIHNANPDVEKVEFYVEQNGKITDHMRDFYEDMPEALVTIRRAHLVPLLGGLLPVPKDRIPAQAADILGWHARNSHRETLDRTGWARYRRLTMSPGTAHGRYGFRFHFDKDIMRRLADRFAERERTNDGTSVGGA